MNRISDIHIDRHILIMHISNIICGHISIYIKYYMPNTILCMHIIHIYWIIHTHTSFYILNIDTCLYVYGCYIFSPPKSLVEWLESPWGISWISVFQGPGCLIIQCSSKMSTWLSSLCFSAGRLSSHYNGLHMTHPCTPGFHLDPEAQQPHVSIYIHLILTWLNSPGHSLSPTQPQNKTSK